MAKYEKILPKESKNIKKFGQNWGMYLPVIRRVATMATSLIQKMTIKNKPCFNNTLTGKSLRGNLQEKLTKFLFKLYVGSYSREPP